MKKIITKWSCLVLGCLLLSSLMKAEDVKTDYTDLLTNPSFEVASDGAGGEVPASKESNLAINGRNDWFRFCPYGWNHTIVQNGNIIPWSLDENNGPGTETDIIGISLGQSYGVNNDAEAKTRNGAYICWSMPSKPLDLFELYQEIPVGSGEGELPPGTYVVSCRLAVMANSGVNNDSGTGGDRFTTQRLFATTGNGNNKVQYFGRESDYEQNLTPGEDASYADWTAENSAGSGARLRPLSVTITVVAGETLRIGIKTSKLKKDGSSGSATDTGWFKTDDFRITGKAPDDFTDFIVNPDFELKDGGAPIGGAHDYTERWGHYGWTRELVKDYNPDDTPIILPWSATENNGAGTETIEPAGATYGQSIGCNLGDHNISTVADRGYRSFWSAPQPNCPEFTLYQDITGLPAGKYRVNCLLFVQEDRHTTQRLFANNSVQFFGRTEDYNLDNQLTRAEKEKNTAGQLEVSYAGYEHGGDFKPVSVDVTITEDETLRIGIRTSGVDPDGNPKGGAWGIIRIDNFRLKQLEDHSNSNALTVPIKESFTIKSQPGGFTLSLQEKAQVRVVSLSGQTVYNAVATGETLVKLPQGVYLVHVSGNGINKVAKALVK